MAEHIWSVLCNKAIIDRDSGQVTIFEAIENLNLPRTKGEIAHEIDGVEEEVAIQHAMQLVTLWVRSDLERPEEQHARVRLLSPSGQELNTWAVPVDLKSFLSLRWRLVFQGVPWRGPGRYWYVVEMKDGEEWGQRCRVPLVLTLKKPPASDQAGGDPAAPE
jgi:hypothetical protein